jgi:hypothetical protein
MQTLTRDELSVHVDASPDEVYALVSDVTRTPEYSPEVLRCTWLDGAEGPAVGVRFAAVNRFDRGPAWRNRPVITVADPGREFSFVRREPLGLTGTIRWTYRMVEEGSGTRVHESYEVLEPITRVGWLLIGGLLRRTDRRAEMREGMASSLARLQAVLEGSPTRRLPPR